jgi:hypothetical protein
MKIEYEWQEFLEEDDRWSALFVRLDNSSWHLAKTVYGTEDVETINTILNDNTSIQEIGNNVIFPNGFIFHKGFINSYKNLGIVNTRKKLKISYTRSMQNKIIRYLKIKQIIY